jgi:hypothetical protein
MRQKCCIEYDHELLDPIGTVANFIQCFQNVIRFRRACGRTQPFDGLSKRLIPQETKVSDAKSVFDPGAIRIAMPSGISGNADNRCEKVLGQPFRDGPRSMTEVNNIALFEMDRDGVRLASDHDWDAIDRLLLRKWAIRLGCRTSPSRELNHVVPAGSDKAPDRIIGGKAVVNRAVGIHDLRRGIIPFDGSNSLGYLWPCFPINSLDQDGAALIQPDKVHIFRISQQISQVCHVFRKTRHGKRFGRERIDLKPVLDRPAGHWLISPIGLLEPYRTTKIRNP